MINTNIYYKRCKSCGQTSPRSSIITSLNNYECSSCKSGPLAKRVIHFYNLYGKIIEAAYHVEHRDAQYLAFVLSNNTKIRLTLMQQSVAYPCKITVTRPGFIGKIKSRKIQYGHMENGVYVFRKHIIANDNDNVINLYNFRLIAVKYIEELDNFKWRLL
jgi:hypothetical protein